MNLSLRNSTLFFSLFLGMLLHSQVRISSDAELELLQGTPMEAVYMHTSGSLFMPGEYLYYSVYCFNTQTYRLSELSEVAYVQLIGADNVVAFTQKIDMEGGRGQGDYFFPTDLPSGNYKLVAYTHWMKNAGISQFFMTDLTFVNPYRSDQNVFLNPRDKNPECPLIKGSSEINAIAKVSAKDLALELGTNEYGKGEAVSLRVKNFKGPRGYGSYSLSVRRMDNLQGPEAITAEGFGDTYSGLLNRIPQRVNDILAIPEQRGELISGRVSNSAGAALAGRSVAISLPGADFQVKKARTDEEGKFYAYLTRPHRTRTGMAELLSPGTEDTNVNFEWYSAYSFEGEIPCFNQFRLEEDMAEAIRKRSIHNQVENSYFEVKPDTLAVAEAPDPFEGEIPDTYELEDFTRFSTLRETLVEYIAFVWIKKDENGYETFFVREPGESPDYTPDPPLVVVDGILVPDRKALLDYDARKIKSIKVLRNKYQLGGENYQGKVAIETIDNVYLENWDTEYGSRFSFLPPSPRKNYFRQTKSSDNVPDFRYQLLWVPLITLDGPDKTFTFFTSQIAGTYEIQLEGFTSFGKPISVRTTFVVEDR